MRLSFKIYRFFTFDKLVGYATIIGCVATVYGAKKIYSLTVELAPVLKVIQKEQNIQSQIVSDTIKIVRRDTVIVKDTVFLPSKVLTDSLSKNKVWERIYKDEERFRKRHKLP